MRCITALIVFIYCRRAAAKGSKIECPELLRYGNWTSECNSYPPGGRANIGFSYFQKIDMTITFGKDNSKLIEMNGSSDSSDLIYLYEIGLSKVNEIGNFTKTCTKKNGYTFENLQRNSSYEINWSVAAVMKNKICQAPFQKVAAFTTPRGDLQVKPSKAVINVTNESATIYWDDSHLDYYYYCLKWKPKECHDEKWMNNTDWKTLGTSILTIDLKEYPHSNLSIPYFFANTTIRNFKSDDKTLEISSNYIGVPDNEITTDLECQNQTCYVQLENNCYKKNGPRIKMLYDLRPINIELSQYIKHDLTGFIESDDEINYQLKLPRFMLNFTAYRLVFTPTNVINVGNPKNSKEITFVTDPSAPNLIPNVTYSSSHTTIIVNWVKPPDLPPTGVLEKFVITWECKNFEKGCKKISESTKVLKTDVGWYSKRLEKLQGKERYYITIEAKNENVTETSATKVYTVSTSDNPSYPEIQTFPNVSENWFSVNVSKPLDLKGDYYVLIRFRDSTIENLMRSSEIIKMNESFVEMEVAGLRGGMQYWVSAQACYSRKECSDWSPEKSIITDFAEPQFGNITLNTAKTTDALITINVPTVDYEEFSGKWNKYVIGRRSDRRPWRTLDETKKILEKNFNTTNALQTSKTSESYLYFKMDDGSVFIPVAKDLSELPFIPDDPGSKMMFAIAVVIFADEGTIAKIVVSGFTEEFKAMFYYASDTQYITIGVCSVIILSFLIFLLFARRYRAKKMNAVKGKKTKDKNKRKKNLQMPSAALKDKKHKINKILRNGELVKPQGRNPVKRVIFKDHPKNLEGSEGEQDDELYANVGFKQDTAVMDYLLKHINCFPLVEKIFKNVPSSMIDLHITCSLLENNRRKNRYTNNLAYDESRVILPTTVVDPSSDYINASYIDSPFRQKCFIAAQGPKEVNVDTRDDFFRMIWFTQPSHIIMIANLIENGKKKVAQYWPDDEEPVWFNDILVTLVSTVEKKNFLIRVLKLQHQGQEMQVNQYQFTTWPDHGIPSHTYQFSQLTQRILREITTTNPIVVHCSAGIGRTGTLILTLVVLSQLELGGYVDFHQALILLRKGRPRLVENPMQFYFAHQLVFDIVSSMEKSISVMDFRSELSVLSPVIRAEYEEIQRIRWSLKEFQFDFASNPLLAHLNRDQYILPADTNLVYLTGAELPVTEQYVNAARVSSDDLEGYYITAEHPTPHTVSKFWKMIYEYEIPVVILVNVFDDVENYPSLVPKYESEVVYDDLLVTVTQSFCQNDGVDSIVEATVTISNTNQPPIAHSCMLIQILNWPHGAELPESPNSFIYAANRIKSARERPCLISCGDGVTGCGLIVAVAMILEHIELGHPINVYKTALETISDRPEAIISEAQYNYLYDVTGYFIEATKTVQPEIVNKSF